jgi:response regulator RpfG family c-di-GMP phosphodiesterase
MNQLALHVSLVGFDEKQVAELTSIIKDNPVTLHSCDLNSSPDQLTKTHLLFMTLANEIIEDGANIDSVETPSVDGSDISVENLENQFIINMRVKSPNCVIYLLATREKILSLTAQQMDVYREVIIYPDDSVFLYKRLNLIISDSFEKLIKVVKKTNLQKRLHESDVESSMLKASLSQSHESTKEANKHLIRLLSNQVFARMGQRASGRNQQLNLLLVEISKACLLDELETQDLTNAWHLRNVGKMGFNDKLLNTPYIKLFADDQRIFNTHPALSHAALMIVRPLDRAAGIILQHKEKIDGSGYPNGLKQADIKMPAQILSVINDYTELVAGRLSDRQYSTVEALEYLDHYASEKYNDDVVNHLKKILPLLSNKGQGMHDLIVNSAELKLGMQLTRDLISKDGILLLSEGLVLDNESILRLQEMESNLGEKFKMFIRKK